MHHQSQYEAVEGAYTSWNFRLMSHSMLYTDNTLLSLTHDDDTQIDANKADRILSDAEVQSALAEHPNAASLVVCQEGFASHPVSIALNPRVDAVLVSEELLRSSASSGSVGGVSNDGSSSTMIESEHYTSNLRLWLS